MKNVFFNELKPRNYSTYSQRMFSEAELLELATIIIENSNGIRSFCKGLIEDLANTTPYNKNFDWNVGSTVQHFPPHAVISAFKKVKSPYLTDSIGLSWVFGEFKIRDPKILDFLQQVVTNGRDSDAWWRAAFSLEKIGVDDAITLLKRSLKSSGLRELDFYLANVEDKKSVIGILLKSTNLNTRDEIFPVLKKMFLTSSDNSILINSIWLLGRFKLVDDEILKRVLQIIKENRDYELIYYTFFAIQELASPLTVDTVANFIHNKDALLRKMAVRYLSYADRSDVLSILEDAFRKESNPYVLSELCQAIYRVKNSASRAKVHLISQFDDIENGLIVDESDKWYADPSIYETFSLAEDPENVCLRVIEQEVKERFSVVRNPIDLATGTGRAFRYLIDKIRYSGSFFAVDRSPEMLDYLQRVINRNHLYVHESRTVESSLDNLSLSVKSDFIISSFGFPSKFSDKKQCLAELQVVYKHLHENGIFVTLGWDETFNDELNYYWFKYIPDRINEFDFEKWRTVRTNEFDSPRNCGLTWYKRGLSVPLQFNNLKESARTMGYLFGRDAARNTIDTKRTNWSMSLGITLNTKDEIRRILVDYNLL